MKSRDDDEGWGVLSSPDVAGDVFAHFSNLVGEGYRTLSAGEPVRFEWEQPGQDGCPFRATQILRGAS